MIERPEASYAKADDGVHIAYQTFGVGRLDILFVPGIITHLDVQWEDRCSTRSPRSSTGCAASRTSRSGA